MGYKILNWDSQFFGFKTARILPPILKQHDLEGILERMRTKQVKLAYWSAADKADFDIEPFGGRLVDEKTTFQVDLTALDPDSFAAQPPVKPYQSGRHDETLFELALQSGVYSRYARDPQFPQDKFVALYREWMRKCLSGELADEILVIYEGEEPAGMATVAAKDGMGHIGLIAVDQAFRGKHFGEALVRAAQQWYLDHSLETAQVVTQGDNRAAHSLYRKCDYQIIRIQYLYHFWL